MLQVSKVVCLADLCSMLSAWRVCLGPPRRSKYVTGVTPPAPDLTSTLCNKSHLCTATRDATRVGCVNLIPIVDAKGLNVNMRSSGSLASVPMIGGFGGDVRSVSSRQRILCHGRRHSDRSTETAHTRHFFPSETESDIQPCIKKLIKVWWAGALRVVWSKHQHTTMRL